MSSSAEAARGSPRGALRLALAMVVVCALAACGFQPAGKVQLPAALHATFVTGSEPYGNLENLLRRALARSGVAVVADRGKASAVLAILGESSQRRVRAVNANGRPAEYALDYRVHYQLLGNDGAVLLAPQSLHLSRDYAYSPTVELGVGREQSAILAQLQADAARLIMLRLEALGRSIAAPAAASAGRR